MTRSAWELFNGCDHWYSERENIMKHNLCILIAAAVLVPGLAFSQPTPNTTQVNEKISQNDRDAIRDRRDASEENARIRQQERDVKKDRSDMRMERREGDSGDASRDRAEISRDNARIRQEERDVRSDRRDIHHKKHHRHDRRSNGQENGEDMNKDRDNK